MKTYSTLFKCGGLDRDEDSLPCECLPGGYEANTKACEGWRKKNMKKDKAK